MKFVRFGTLAPQKQSSNAPAKQGIWAFPHGFRDDFYLSATRYVAHPSQKVMYLRDENGNKIRAESFFSDEEDEDGFSLPHKEYLPLLKKKRAKYRDLHYERQPDAYMVVVPKDYDLANWPESLRNVKYLYDIEGEPVATSSFYQRDFCLTGLSLPQREKVAELFPNMNDYLREHECNIPEKELQIFQNACASLGFKPDWRNAQWEDIEPEIQSMLQKKRIPFHRVIPDETPNIGFRCPYVVMYHKPRVFEYDGPVWSRLFQYVRRKDILRESPFSLSFLGKTCDEPAWILTTTPVLEKAIQRALAEQKFSAVRDEVSPGMGWPYHKTNSCWCIFEVFIEEKI
ncbi:MAG: hypothetical protein Q4C96_10840 [Planctomycetia bacterium]|nr:hypothetical protein [Planctomycetia bacterium]